MRYRSFSSALLLTALAPTILAAPGSSPRDSFAVTAKFSVDNPVLAFSSAVAEIEPRRNAPGYSWLRIHFYTFVLSAEDVAAAQRGDVAYLDDKAGINSGNPDRHNSSLAIIKLTVDQASKVWQVDMVIPGHSCTIGPFPNDVQSFLQAYSYDFKTLRLKSKRSYTCDLTSVNDGPGGGRS